MRLLILGPPASGKSTLASALESRCAAAIIDLDDVALRRSGSGIRVVDYDARCRRAAALAARSAWIANGNYLGWIEPLMVQAEVIVWLQANLPLQLRRIVARHVRRSWRGDNPYPGWRPLLGFLRYTIQQHYGRLEPYTAQDVRIGPASTARELAPFTGKVMELSASLPVDAQCAKIRDFARRRGDDERADSR